MTQGKENTDANIVGALGALRKQKLKLTQFLLMTVQGILNVLTLPMMAAIITTKCSPSVTMILCKRHPVCLMSNQAQPFYYPF